MTQPIGKVPSSIQTKYSQPESITFSTQCSSTIKTASDPKPYTCSPLKEIGQCIKAVFKAVWRAIAWTFTCGYCCCCSGEETPEESSLIDIVPPSVERDETTGEVVANPFLDIIYKIDESGDRTVKDPGRMQMYSEMFGILRSVSQWITNSSRLVEIKKITRTLTPPSHPFQVLFYALGNKTQTQALHDFCEASDVKNWNWATKLTVLKLIKVFNNGENPWESFLNDTSRHFNKHKALVSPVVASFCEYFHLDESTVRGFVDREDWKGLICYVKDTREKEFGIS